MNIKKRLFILFLMSLFHLFLALYWSRDNLFYYGRIAYTWKIFYEGFWTNLFSDYIPPGFYILSGLLHRVTHYSIGFWQKVIDLASGEFIIIFFTLKQIKSKKWWLIPLIGFSSVGFFRPLITQGGEGLVALLIVIGIYYWRKRDYLKGSLLLGLSVWFKFTFYFILPVFIIFCFLEYKRLSRLEKKKFLWGIFIIFISIASYQILDHFHDFSFQLTREKNLDGNSKVIFLSFLSYLNVVIINFPLLIIAHKYIKLNFYFMCGLLVLLALSLFGSTSYYYFAFLALFFASLFQDKACLKISKRTFITALVLNLVIFLPCLVSSTGYFTKQDYQQVVSTIQQDYHGGTVVIPLKFALEFPFKHYIADSLPKGKDEVSSIEWIVAGNQVPEILTKTEGCYCIYHKKISSLITLYKYKCDIF